MKAFVACKVVIIVAVTINYFCILQFDDFVDILTANLHAVALPLCWMLYYYKASYFDPYAYHLHESNMCPFVT